MVNLIPGISRPGKPSTNFYIILIKLPRNDVPPILLCILNPHVVRESRFFFKYLYQMPEAFNTC